MRILVTGGAGFIGSHLVDALLKDYHTVVVLDDLSGGFQRNVDARATLVVGSCENEALVDALFKHHKFEGVYHLAAYAAEGLSHFIRRFNYANNLMASINIINACIKYEIRKLIFTSSMSVYGSGIPPFTEDMLLQPEDPYAIAKAAVEKDLDAASKMFGLDYTIFRPHNVYGIRQNIWDPYRNVIGIFMYKLLTGKPLPIFGDGSQQRAFTHISNCVAPMVKALTRDNTSKQTYNVGGTHAITIEALADKVEEVLEAEYGREYLPSRLEVHAAYSKHTKLEFDFRGQKLPPEVSLEEGLRGMAKWARLIFNLGKPTVFWNIENNRNLPPNWRHAEYWKGD